LDQQQWEKKLEERMLKGIHFDVARKVAKLKTELIDLDLIRGSAFSKAKPKQSWLTSTYFGIVRVCLFPFYFRWWSEQSNRAVSVGLLLLWALQVSAMFVYFSCDQLNNSDKFQTIPLSELISPLVMFFILGSIHSQISASALISLKAKLLTKVSAVGGPTNGLSNVIGSARLTKCDLHDESRRNSSTASLNLLHSQRIAPLILAEDSALLRMATSAKKSFLTKPVVSSGLRKRKKSFGSNRSIVSNRKNASNDQVMSAEITSNEDLSPYSTFHGQLNDRLDHLLSCKTKPESLDEEAVERSTAERRSLRIPMSRASKKKKSKSVTSSTSVSLSNFSTDASGGKTTQPEVVGMRSKETQCELSSSESDRGMPPSPIKVLNDWPMINSDCSSDDDDDDDDDDVADIEEEKEPLLDDELLSTCTNRLANDNEDDLLLPVERQRTRSRTIDEDSIGNVRGRKIQFSSCLTADGIDHEFVKSAVAKDESQLPSIGATKTGQSDQSTCTFFITNPISFIKVLFLPFSSDRTLVSCSIYQHNEWRKMELSVLDISSIVIRKVASHTHSNEYFYLGICCSLLLAIMPQIFRLQQNCPVMSLNANETNLGSTPVLLQHFQPLVLSSGSTCGSISASNSTKELIDFLHLLPVIVVDLVYGIFSNHTYTWQMQYVVIVACLQRFFLSLLFFFFLCVAERTFREVNHRTRKSKIKSKLIFFFRSKSKAITLRQTLFSHDFGSSRQKSRITSLPVEQSAQHQVLAFRSIIPEASRTSAFGQLHCLD
jgi:hypothetical protein